MIKNEQQLYKKLKQQRVIIFMIILLIPITGWFSFKYFCVNDINDEYFSMLDPLRRFISAENYITNIQDLREYLRKIGEQYPDSISIYYESINSGSNISINKDLRLFPASLSKLVQAILIVKKVEKGNLSFDKELKAMPSDLSSGSGTLYKTIGDKSMTVENLLKELLVNSDNTAQNIFKHYLDFSDYEKFQNNTGLQDLYNEQGFISAKEYTRILRVLYTSNFLKPENSEKILKYMSEATFQDFLSKGIPKGVKFAHKYGENQEYNIFADSGIVYIPGKPYMISVLFKGKDSTYETRLLAINLMKEISEYSYNISK
jgi:beta-lactamase class A